MFSAIERLNYADAFIKVNQKPLELDFWQEKFIQDTSKYSCILKSRRTGFSFITALKGVIKANDPDRIKYTRQFVSYNEDDAKEKIIYAKEFYDSIPKKYKKDLVSDTKTTMEFFDKGGKTISRLISIPCRPPRGRGGDIVFDEMGIYPRNKARVIYTAGLPVIARGGCVEIGSTPLGKIGTFYDIFMDKEQYPEYNRYTVPWWFVASLATNIRKAVAECPILATAERVEKYGTHTIKSIFNSLLLEDFQQEFECTFIDAALSYISLDLIHSNTPGMRETDRNYEFKEDEEESNIEVRVFKTADELLLGYDLHRHGRLYIGYDVAKHRDAAVIFVIGLLGSEKKLSVAEIEMVHWDYSDQKAELRKILNNLPVIRACIDSTGVGNPIYEDLYKEYGTSKVEGVDFTQQSKETMAILVRTGLEQQQFLLQNDKKFHRQIHSIKRMVGVGGGFRYDSERDETGHADSFWAWALANYAINDRTAKRENFYSRQKIDKGIVSNKGKSFERVMRDLAKGKL